MCVEGFEKSAPLFFEFWKLKLRSYIHGISLKKLIHTKMSKYRTLRSIPMQCELLEEQVKPNPRELVITLVSCMCDNKSTMNLKKNQEGDFKLTCGGEAYSNFQTKFRKDEIEWAADDGNFFEVFKMINSGTSVIDEVKSR
jgi:hypothetical protein